MNLSGIASAIMKKTSLLLILNCIIYYTGFAQSPKDAEKDLQQKIDLFMRSNKSALSSFEKAIETYPDSAGAKRNEFIRSSPFIKSLQTFFQQQEGNYANVRSHKFSQFLPPPVALLELHWDSVSLHELIVSDLFTIVFVRAVDPGVIEQILHGLMIGELSSQLSQQELVGYYRTRSLFGDRIYTKHLSGDEWQVWSADRMLAVTFRINVRNGRISGIARTDARDTGYQQIQLPSSLAHATDNMVKLQEEIRQINWDSYPDKDFDPTYYSSYLQQRNESLYQFFEKNRTRYKTVREEQLRSLKPPPQLPQGFKDLVPTDLELINERDVNYISSTILSPSACETSIITATSSQGLMERKDIAKSVQHMSIFGVSRYARKLSGEEWEITAVGPEEIITYHWDISSGRISNIHYWVKG